MVLVICAAIIDALSPTSRRASAARTAARSATTFLKTLRVIGTASRPAPPRTRVPTGT